MLVLDVGVLFEFWMYARIIELEVGVEKTRLSVLFGVV
jgi:hypothetical protein